MLFLHHICMPSAHWSSSPDSQQQGEECGHLIRGIVSNLALVLAPVSVCVALTLRGCIYVSQCRGSSSFDLENGLFGNCAQCSSVCICVASVQGLTCLLLACTCELCYQMWNAVRDLEHQASDLGADVEKDRYVLSWSLYLQLCLRHLQYPALCPGVALESDPLGPHLSAWPLGLCLPLWITTKWLVD